MPHLLVVELRSDPLIKGLLTRLVLRNFNKAGLYLSSECLLCFIRTKDIVATVLDQKQYQKVYSSGDCFFQGVLV